jgi:hypothetical protein
MPMTHHERRLWDAAERVVEAQDFVEQAAPGAPETVADAVENLRGAMTSLEPVWFGDADTEDGDRWQQVREWCAAVSARHGNVAGPDEAYPELLYVRGVIEMIAEIAS